MKRAEETRKREEEAERRADEALRRELEEDRRMQDEAKKGTWDEKMDNQRDEQEDNGYNGITIEDYVIVPDSPPHSATPLSPPYSPITPVKEK